MDKYIKPAIEIIAIDPCGDLLQIQASSTPGAIDDPIDDYYD